MAARTWQVANGIMALLFLFSAAVQLNDPDPLWWVAVYAGAAALCALELRRGAPAWAVIALALVAFAWSASIWLRVRDVPIASLFAEWEMRDVQVEEARETYGLAIVGAWMLAILAARMLRARARRAPTGDRQV